jgi:hypothetical protein
MVVVLWVIAKGDFYLFLIVFPVFLGFLDFCFVLFGEEARGSIFFLSVCLSGQIDARCAGFCKPVIVASLCWWLAFLFLSPTPRPFLLHQVLLRVLRPGYSSRRFFWWREALAGFLQVRQVCSNILAGLCFEDFCPTLKWGIGK